MATRLGLLETENRRASRAVVRETADVDPCYHQRLMVRLDEGGRFLELWQKGRRHRVRVTYGETFQYALMRDARAAVRAKKLQREQRGKRRNELT